MKDPQTPIHPTLSFFYKGKAAYFWLPATMKKDGKCAYRKDDGAYVSIPSSCGPLSLLLTKVMSAIATLDTRAPKKLPW